MTTPTAHILLADGDESFIRLVAEYLGEKGYECDVALDGEQVMDRVLRSSYDLILMDVVLPKRDGLDVLSDLRESGNRTPVLFLTSRSTREDILKAYRLGCEDYQLKPCRMELLLCRVEVLLRLTQRVESVEQPVVFDLGMKHFDAVNQLFDGEHLSARESELLALFCRNEGKMVDRRKILLSLWQKDDFFASRSLSVYVNRLRHRLEGTGYRILVSHNKGYKLVAE